MEKLCAYIKSDRELLNLEHDYHSQINFIEAIIFIDLYYVQK